MEEKKEGVNYEVVKGVMERAGLNPDNFNNTELQKFFNATPETISRLRDKEEYQEAVIQFGDSYERILEILDYYMDIPEGQAKLIAIWILGTYLHETFNTFPFLFINAMRGSGKTRLLKIISHLAYGGTGMVSTEPTEAVLYRTPKHHTLCFDEFEGIGGKEKSTFRQYMNASYKKGGIVQRAKKVRKEKEENYEIEYFEPYKPIAMANIWGMEEVLGDRCLTIILQKSNNSAKTKKIEDFDTNPAFKTVKSINANFQCSLCSVVTSRNYITTWNNYISTLYTNYITNTNNTNYIDYSLEEMFLKIEKSDIDGRNLELIFPLLITARLLNPDIFEEILDICKEMVKVKKEDELSESKDVTFIDYIASRYDADLKYHPINEITREFRAYLSEIEDVDDKWLNTKWIGRALKRLDLIIDKRRVARGNEVTLNVVKAKEKLKMFKPLKKEVEDEDT